MRIAGQKKGGFYAAPVEAVSHVITERIESVDEKAILLDPCCGEGVAIQRVAQELSAPAKQVFACELEPTRFQTASETLLGSHVINSNWLSASCDISSFSFVWLNPPFDDEIGGGERMEHTFLKQTTRLVVTGGVMCLICPERIALDNYGVRTHFAMFYDMVTMTPFPEGHRPFKEVAIMGVKLAEPADSYDASERRNSLFSIPYDKLKIPRGYRPLHFSKSEMLDWEIDEAMRVSPLSKSIQATPVVKPMSPPLALGKGHIALLLSSGYLNGVVRPDGEPPHVVRGTARKINYVSDVSESDDGKTTVTKSEKISMVVRAVGSDGLIKTFSDQPDDATDAEPSDDD